ncbi:hypothetical protein GCM10009798_40960 [Nocardioides panacihumi]|uniref:Endonuclease/exonuclease/phosphatase domain-containing protein n=1 Tax=Nocardioides panacihumi TaxID=400774 RepID=A0ABN2RVH9_9ACTN
MATTPLTDSNAAQQVRIASWNCAGAFREKVGRALALDADIYVIQEAEPLPKYDALLPDSWETHYVARDDFPKGVLVLAREGFTLSPQPEPDEPKYAHVVPTAVTGPTGDGFDLWGVWTLDASPKEAAYVGQAHLALDDLGARIRLGTVMIGDFNSNAIWDHMRVRHHSLLVERLAALGLSSAYHRWTGEPQGSETQPTFYLHRSEAKPFHIDHCFTDLEVIGVEVGTFADWSGLKSTGGVSDHVPLIVSVRLPTSAVAGPD